MTPARKLVVRSYAPRRRAAMLGASIVLGCACLYGVFELGRYVAGYNVVDAVRDAWLSNRRIAVLEKQNASERVQIAADEIARRVDREGYAQLERNLADMQGQIARLNQSLAFYRGLVQPDSLVKAKVQQMQIVPAAGTNRYELKFTLMQVGKPTGRVSGRIELTLLGRRAGQDRSLAFAQVSPERPASLSYSFRDFQNFDEALRLPRGFAPERIAVVLRDGGGREYRQAFLWRTRGMSSEADGAGVPAKGGPDVQAQKQ